MVKKVLGWVGIIILGLALGALEDLMFVRVVVEYAPPSWDLTGALFFPFTVPLSQVLALAITVPLAWFFLGLRELPRLITFWACWSIARTAFLILLKNPVEDVVIYLVWIAVWCASIGLFVRFLDWRQDVETAPSVSS